MIEHSLPTSLYTASETRELDRLAISEAGISGGELMERAGAAAFLLLRDGWPVARRLAIMCGGGNNGGDGYVMARLAAQAGLKPTVYACTSIDALQGDALLMAQRALAQDVPVIHVTDAAPDLSDADVIVDALLGTGLRGPVRAELGPLIGAINASACPVLAVDIPSGLSADSGATMGEAVRADQTITFIGVKRGLLTGDGPDCTGTLHFDDLDVPQLVYQRLPSSCARPVLNQLLAALPARRRTAHKGQCGHVLIIGGDYGYAGAAVLAAQAAARCGAGLITVATRKEHCSLVVTRQPEVMVAAIETADDLDLLLEKASVVVIGPGLGQGSWGHALLNRVLGTVLPRVIDADGLNLLARKKREPATMAQVITPHPGEAGRLLSLATGAIQQDRFAAVDRLQKSFGGTVLLKGAGTLVASADKILSLNTSGNPGMAGGGMGDVLSGVIGALLAQGLDSHDAARFGALVHGLAADCAAASDGQKGLLATDLLFPLRHLINGLTA